MSIPTNITREHLEKAIERIDKEGIPLSAASMYYDVDYNGKKYPPKLVVSYANVFANGVELDRNSFPGGKDTPCFKLLNHQQFKIVPKGSNSLNYTDELKRFLKQAHSGDLKTAHYKKGIDVLQVKVSFGQGNPARVPWIAFYSGNDSVQEGIYPVYLYYKEKELLILAYGVSETNVPTRTWRLPNAKTIETFFSENGFGSPERYGSSFVYKVYDVKNGLDEENIDNDLRTLIEIYKNTLDDNSVPAHERPQKFDYQNFYYDALKAGLFINEKLAHRYITSLLTKPFVILTGLSGSGKTKLAQSFAYWLSKSQKHYCIVPVGADWTNREHLLGFPNALKDKDYIKPESGVLDLMLDASKNPNEPYFLILDEMNLSHVERYFADFLSIMESGNRLSLHPGKEDWNGVPPSIHFLKNLFIIGTVNIDETTYMFSPKVLDRANVVEFRITEDEMASYFKNRSLLDLDLLKGKGVQMSSSFLEIAKSKDNAIEISDELNKELIKFFRELKKAGAEFGFRTAAEIFRFVHIGKLLSPNSDLFELVDLAIMQKLLPKLHGSKRKLEGVLKILGNLCLQPELSFEDALKSKKFDDPNIKFKVSFEKIIRMYENLISNGFTSYAEA